MSLFKPRSSVFELPGHTVSAIQDASCSSSVILCNSAKTMVEALKQRQPLVEIGSSNMTTRKRSIDGDVLRSSKRAKMRKGNAYSFDGDVHIHRDVQCPLKHVKMDDGNTCSIDLEREGVNYHSSQKRSFPYRDVQRPLKRAKMERLQKTLKWAALTDFFQPNLLRAHISSLRDLNAQDAVEEIPRHATLHNASEYFCQLCYVDEKLFFAAAEIYCSSCGALIKHKRIYFCNSEDCGKQYSFCSSCYNKSNTIVDGDAVCRTQLLKTQNIGDEEPWVQCARCEKWQHQLCALFNDQLDLDGEAVYICPLCKLKEIEAGEQMPYGFPAPFGAMDLPKSNLSYHIEHRLFNRLKQERQEKAGNDLVVRVVLSVKKRLEVKSQLLSLFKDKRYPSEFPYRSRVILLFQKIDGVDVCLFAMFVQEFGSECCHPNHRSIYISYLDSVKHFIPHRKSVAGESLRTIVYHEILLGYLDYCKRRGFVNCHIWSCPPLKGDDYIFHCHPAIQKTPKPHKLRQWYKLMLKKAEEEKIVLNSTNLCDYFLVPGGDSITGRSTSCLPYFDGHCWLDIAGDVLKDFECDASKELRDEVNLQRRRLKNKGCNGVSKECTKDLLLIEKLAQKLSECREDLMIAILQHVCANCDEVIFSGKRWLCDGCKNFQLCTRCHDERERIFKKMRLHHCDKDSYSLCEVDEVPIETEDNDVDFENNYLEDRHAFLEFCRQNNYQFDTLRRAKHSSMMILYHLHHMHDRIHSSDGVVQIKLLRVKKLLDLLVHASNCDSSLRNPCSYPNCLKIKLLYRHACRCDVRAPRGCQLCIKAWKLLIAHSRSCRSSNCRVPRCRDLREKREKDSKIHD